MFFTSKSTKTLHWMPLECVGTNCDKKFLRVAADVTAVLIEAGDRDDPGAALRTRLLGQGATRRFAKGEIGFCYAAHAGGVIYVGFGRDPKSPPSPDVSPTQYAYRIKVTYDMATKFEIEAPCSSGIEAKKK